MAAKKNPNINKYNKDLLAIKKIKPDADCFWIPNAKYDCLKLSKNREKHLDTQKERYGFTECETWELDYTACIWLYSHIKMMLDIGGKIVDYEWEWWGDEFRKELQEVGVDTDLYHNDKMVFEYICELLEVAESYANYEPDPQDDIDASAKLCMAMDNKAMELRSKAFKVFAVMMPRAGW